MEEWKTVKGTDGMIEVSNEGRVRSLLRGTPYILKATEDSKGYLRLKITIKRVHRSYKVHRMVAQAFIPNPELLPQVNHIDGDKKNNNVNNLEWVTNQQNVIHAFSQEKVSVHELKYIPRKIISRTNRGNEARKKAIIACKDDKIMNFTSISEAERYFNSRHICDVLKGKRQSVKGWSFFYAKGGDCSCQL